MAIEGWYFTGTGDTPEYPDASAMSGHVYVTWKDMDTSLLDELLTKLTEAGNWESHILYIERELRAREPPVVITSVMVEGELK